MRSSGYGKKPLWFWLLVYAVIGVVAYFVIYLAFFSGGGGGGGLGY
jgi:hypothetical protein